MCLDVTYLPSCPARGLSFAINCMEIVGSEIFWNGIASAPSTSQIVSPIDRSEIPEIATIDPTCALFTSTLSSPSNSYNLVIRTFSLRSGS